MTLSIKNGNEERENLDPSCYNSLYLDSVLFERSGTLQLMTYKLQSKQGDRLELFKKIYEKLNRLMNQEKQDKIHLRVCHRKLSELCKANQQGFSRNYLFMQVLGS